MKNDKGFSLIELIIVIAMMAVLVAVIAPNLTKYLGSSKQKADLANKEEIKKIMEQACALTDVEVAAPDSSKDGQWVVLSADSVYFDDDAADVGGYQAFPKFVADALMDVPVSKQNGKPFKVRITTSADKSYKVEVETQ